MPPVIPPTIDPYPEAPVRSLAVDQGAFDAVADAWAASLEPRRVQTEALADNVYDNAVDAAASAQAAETAQTHAETAETNAETAQGLAEQARDAAAASAASALNAPGTNATSDTEDTIALGSTIIDIEPGKAFSVGQRVVQASRANPANQQSGIITGHDPETGELTIAVDYINGSGTFDDWTVSLTGARGADGDRAVKVALSADHALVEGDQNDSLILTGSHTLALLPAATAGDGFMFWVRNDGTGVWTIDGDNAETINGLASIKVYGGEGFAIICDGTTWRTFGRPTKVLISTATVSTAVAAIDCETGFGDPEFRVMELVGEGFSGGTNGGVPQLSVKKSGSYTSLGTISTHAGATSTTANFTVTASHPNATQAYASNISIVATASTGTLDRDDVSDSTAAALQGLRISMSAGKIDAGTVRLYAYR